MADTTSSSVSPFNFGTHAVRVVMRDSQPWFSAADVCLALGVKNYRDSTAHLDEDERGVVSTDTPASNQYGPIAGQFENMLVVNESGLYALVLRSRKPEARKFAKWVTSEVLPAIRKTGSYELPNLYRQGKTDKLSAEQQQALRQLLEENVKRLPHAAQAGAMIKGWSKLKSHFGVGYRDIPAERYPEAVNLLTRHLSELLDPQAQAMALSDKERIGLAIKMATQVSSEVTVAVLNAVLSGNDNWKSDRWMFGLTYKAGPGNDPMVSWASQVPHSACVMSMDEMAKAITAPDGLAPTDAELANLASACTQRLASRMSTRPNQPLALSA